VKCIKCFKGGATHKSFGTSGIALVSLNCLGARHTNSHIKGNLISQAEFPLGSLHLAVHSFVIHHNWVLQGATCCNKQYLTFKLETQLIFSYLNCIAEGVKIFSDLSWQYCAIKKQFE
jgi:hypothetical protein